MDWAKTELDLNNSEAGEIVLCITNEGSLHRDHMMLAEGRMTISGTGTANAWLNRVTDWVRKHPDYGHCKPYVYLLAAIILEQHYRRVVQENRSV